MSLCRGERGRHFKYLLSLYNGKVRNRNILMGQAGSRSNERGSHPLFRNRVKEGSSGYPINCKSFILDKCDLKSTFVKEALVLGFV